MKRYQTKRTYRVRCKSKIMGWRTRLRNNYLGLMEWAHNSDMWGLCSRLGFTTPEAAWKANPIVEGSTNPDDFRKVE